MSEESTTANPSWTEVYQEAWEAAGSAFANKLEHNEHSLDLCGRDAYKAAEAVLRGWIGKNFELNEKAVMEISIEIVYELVARYFQHITGSERPNYAAAMVCPLNHAFWVHGENWREVSEDSTKLHLRLRRLMSSWEMKGVRHNE